LKFYGDSKVRLTPEQVVEVLQKAGWKQKNIPYAYAIIMRESNRYPNVYNVNSNDTVDFGLFQINQVNFNFLGVDNPRNLFNPEYNAKMALKLFNKYNLSPWAVRNTDGTLDGWAAHLAKTAPATQQEYQKRYDEFLKGYYEYFKVTPPPINNTGLKVLPFALGAVLLYVALKKI